ncbi:MAG: hypothetical protein RIM84_07135 [Alphaproteobacteria bacterium]
MGALDRQSDLNAKSRDLWDDYAGHRAAVTGLLLSRAPFPRARLCVLGAGNANDLDLARLYGPYGEIDLVDCDQAALERARARQPVPGTRAIGGVDLSGIAGLLDGGAPLADCLAALDRYRPDWADRRYDMVLSAGLLSQLVLGAIEAWGEDHPDLPALLAALRSQHVRLLLDLAGEQGQVLLVSDLVSTDTVPDLAATPADKLKDRMVALIEAGNFFTGLNPYALLKGCQDDVELSARIGEAHLLRPWLWRLGPRRGYLVYALLLLPTRKGTPGDGHAIPTRKPKGRSA